MKIPKPAGLLLLVTLLAAASCKENSRPTESPGTGMNPVHSTHPEDQIPEAVEPVTPPTAIQPEGPGTYFSYEHSIGLTTPGSRPSERDTTDVLGSLSAAESVAPAPDLSVPLEIEVKLRQETGAKTSGKDTGQPTLNIEDSLKGISLADTTIGNKTSAHIGSKNTQALSNLNVSKAFPLSLDMATPDTDEPVSARTTGQGSSSNEPAAVTRKRARLQAAGLVYNQPEEMWFGEPVYLELFMMPGTAAGEIAHKVTEPGEIVEAAIDISSRVHASLRYDDDGFDVDPITPETQLVFEDRPTEWKWRITPISWGEQRLTLVVNSILDFEGQQTTSTLETYESTFNVRVNPVTAAGVLITNHWQWLITAIVIPLIGWGYNVWRKRKN